MDELWSQVAFPCAILAMGGWMGLVVAMRARPLRGVVFVRFLYVARYGHRFVLYIIIMMSVAILTQAIVRCVKLQPRAKSWRV